MRCPGGCGVEEVSERITLSLSGDWEVGTSFSDHPAEGFPSRCQVPGLIDLAQPALAWEESAQRAGKVWYKATFAAPKARCERATLRVSQALYGYEVVCNGVRVGERHGGFVSGEFELGSVLRWADEENEVLIGVNADRSRTEEAGWPAGYDREKFRYIPGICDEIEVLFSGFPAIRGVQISPDLTFEGEESVLVRVDIDGAEGPFELRSRIFEDRSGEICWDGIHMLEATGPKRQSMHLEIPVPRAHYWTPADPFLYRLNLQTAGDRQDIRFGMRRFRFNPRTARAELNGRTIFLGGTNICIHRFYEDPERRSLPWDRDWVRTFLRSLKSMNWNCARFSIGFPPRLWYELCDEEGLLIQDEAPVWDLPPKTTIDTLGDFYKQWIHDHANHPSVVIWDAQNETPISLTRRAVQTVRGVDLSDRPWDLGWDRPPLRPDDVFESHPYLFYRHHFDLDDLALISPEPVDARFRKEGRSHNPGGNPIIINEYSWLWLNRDGSLTTLSRQDRVYERLGLDKNATQEERRRVYADTIALLTEFWRSGDRIAGLMHFCSLTSSLPNGCTSDDWLDVGKLIMDPCFERRVSDSFSPVIAIPMLWNRFVLAAEVFRLGILVINDTTEGGTYTVTARLLVAGQAVDEYRKTVTIGGSERLRFDVPLRGLRVGDCQFEVELFKEDKPVVCRRRLQCVPIEKWQVTV